MGVLIEAKISELYGATRQMLLDLYGRAVMQIDSLVHSIRDTAVTNLMPIQDGARDLVANPKAKATMGGAAGGAVAGGASGGAAGLMTGGALGAAVGVIPAFFTFGLSIPIGAAIGGGTGLVVGTAGGATVGAVGGGAAGYGVETHKKEIQNGMNLALAKTNACRDYVKETAIERTQQVRSKVDQVKETALEKTQQVKSKVFSIPMSKAGA